MKFVFVGIHHKNNLPALCSSTKTGEIIDTIISHFNEDFQWEKVNLFPTNYLPMELEEREKLIDLFPIVEDYFYLGFGVTVKDTLERLTKNSKSFYHPGFAIRKGNVFKEKYIKGVVDEIERIMCVNYKSSLQKN